MTLTSKYLSSSSCNHTWQALVASTRVMCDDDSVLNSFFVVRSEEEKTSEVKGEIDISGKSNLIVDKGGSADLK